MLRIALKDLKLFTKDRKAVLLTYLLPVVLITLFSIAFGGLRNSKPSPQKLLVNDQDSTELSLKTIGELETLKGLAIEMAQHDEAISKVKEGKRLAVLVFHHGFEDSVNEGRTVPVELIYDAAREVETGILQQALISKLVGSYSKIAARNKVKRNMQKKYESMDSSAFVNIQESVDEQFSDNTSDEDNSELKLTALEPELKENPGIVQSVGGVSVMMLLFVVAGIGSSILQEKEEGTLKRLLCSPLNPYHILSGKLIYSVFISLTQLIVMFVYTWLVFGLNIFLDIPSLLAMLLATAIACASFGIFLASICSTRKQVDSLSVIVILIMSAIGGSMMPLFMMPQFMQKLAVISVNYWAINGFYDIFWRHLPFMKVMHNVGVLIGMGSVMTAVSLFLFKRHITRVI